MLINLFLITGTSASICYGIWGEVPCPNAGEPDYETPEDVVEGPTGSLQELYILTLNFCLFWCTVILKFG